MNRTPAQLIGEFFDAVSAGELPDLLLTPDMTAWTTLQGRMDKAAYQNVIRLLAKMTARSLAFAIDSVTAQEDRIVAEVHSDGELINGEPYTNSYAFAFRVRGGRIASVAEHFNALIVQQKLIPLMAQIDRSKA